MTAHTFTLAGTDLLARPSGALFWPEHNLLCVSDLHLGNPEQHTHNQSRDTLERLDQELTDTGARTVICLGDSFDSSQAATSLTYDEKLWVSRMQAGRRWVWIAGSHAAAPVDLGGTHLASLPLAPLTFCPVADKAQAGEISGYYHPKTALTEYGRKLTRPCFLYDSDRLIMPAFGIYSGGLRNSEVQLASLMRSEALAVPTGPSQTPQPMLG